MSSEKLFGFAGKLLRVDLTTGEIKEEGIKEAILKKYIGGAGLGCKYIYDEVQPEVTWSDPDNRLFIGSGPLGGTRIGGSGAVTVVTKGALTNGMASSQANGVFGAYLRFCGYDAIIIQGAAPEWRFLHIGEDTVALKDARHLIGKDTFATDRDIKTELKISISSKRFYC